MEKFLGTARTVDELLEMIEPYSGFNIFLEGCDYNSPEVYVYWNEEEKTINMKVKYVKKLPESCSQCRNFYLKPYICHNERGLCGVCTLGYIKDGRDFIGKSRFSGCKLKVKEE